MATTVDRQTIAAKILDTRTKRGWTRGQVVESLGWDTEQLRRIETGRAPVSVDDLEPLSGALGVTVADLLGLDGGAPEREVVVTVTRHHCERCLGKWGDVETLVRADLAALDGVIGLNRTLTGQAVALAAAMDLCPDPAKLTSLSRELRIVMDTLAERVGGSGGKGATRASGSGGGADGLADLGVPVLSQ